MSKTKSISLRLDITTISGCIDWLNKHAEPQQIPSSLSGKVAAVINSLIQNAIVEGSLPDRDYRDAENIIYNNTLQYAGRTSDIITPAQRKHHDNLSMKSGRITSATIAHETDMQKTEQRMAENIVAEEPELSDNTPDIDSPDDDRRALAQQARAALRSKIDETLDNMTSAKVEIESPPDPSEVADASDLVFNLDEVTPIEKGKLPIDDPFVIEGISVLKENPTKLLAVQYAYAIIPDHMWGRKRCKQYIEQIEEALA